jgi:hypothetical protein
VESNYRRKQALHHRLALEKLHKQWQQSLAASSCSDSGSGQLPVVTTRTYDPAGILPFPALDTSLSPSNEDEIHEETRVMSVSRAASPPYVKTPFPAEAQSDPYYLRFGRNIITTRSLHVTSALQSSRQWRIRLTRRCPTAKSSAC